MSKKKKPTKKNKKGESKSSSLNVPYEIKALSFFGAAGVLFLSLYSFRFGQDGENYLGLFGYSIAYLFLWGLGFSAFLICPALIWEGVLNALHLPSTRWIRKAVLSFIFLFSLSIISEALGDFSSHFFSEDLSERVLREKISQGFLKKTEFISFYGGIPAHLFFKELPFYSGEALFSHIGTIFLFSLTALYSFSFLTGLPLFKPFRLLFSGLRALWMKLAEKKREIDFGELNEKRKKLFSFWPFTRSTSPQKIETKIAESTPSYEPKDFTISLNDDTSLPDYDIEGVKEALPKSQTKKLKAPPPVEAISDSEIDYSNFQLPSTGLLTPATKVDRTSLKENLKVQASTLEEALSSFGIEAKVGNIHCGPTITLFEVHPAVGVKVQKIKALENDIALNMRAKSIRIIAPIPGKAAVGIEVPNPMPQEVGFKELFEAYQGGTKKLQIPAILGKTVHGDLVLSDLTKMPHCIIAGATGSGKSVCINTVIMSIIMNAKPDEVKLLMVDPKKVELTPYTNLPHMMAPVITEPQEAYAALCYLVREMERRYEILKYVGVRNIISFNQRVPDVEKEIESPLEIPEKMFYIVCVVDELADLMMVANQDIETPIARIAQMARAVGIHLVLATQRPSREVITGLIKANFPTRIAFKVASRVNSQIILDENGAETLLGNGDMLFLPPGSSNLMRAQGAYIRDEDINKVIAEISRQAPPNYLIPSFEPMGGGEFGGLGEPGSGEGDVDALFRQAVEIVTTTGTASTTFLQRKLKVGYARAASIMDQLEENGIVGPQDGSKARKVLIGGRGEEE